MSKAYTACITKILLHGRCYLEESGIQSSWMWNVKYSFWLSLPCNNILDILLVILFCQRSVSLRCVTFQMFSPLSSNTEQDKKCDRTLWVRVTTSQSNFRQSLNYHNTSEHLVLFVCYWGWGFCFFFVILFFVFFYKASPPDYTARCVKRDAGECRSNQFQLQWVSWWIFQAQWDQ